MSLETVRSVFEPVIRRVMHFYWRFARGMTLGVRALVIDEKRGVFLVKHSYVSGWHLPGGGVEADETLLDALIRELREEANIEPTAPPKLHGMFFKQSRVAPRSCRRLCAARFS
jgi:8-oxo-dGTP pyrophosphatase MutT (NUDIX family)